MPRPVNLSDVPYLPSSLVDLPLIEVDNPEVIIDLGSGDGRILKWFGEKFPEVDLIGYELDEGRADESETNVPAAQIVRGNMWDATNMEMADLVYVYWLENLMSGFLDYFWPQLKSGTYVVSNCFAIEGLTPVQVAGNLYVYKKD